MVLRGGLDELRPIGILLCAANTMNLTELYSQLTVELTPAQLEELAEEYYRTDFPGRRPATIYFSRAWVNKWLRWMKGCHHTSVTYQNMQAYATRCYENYKPKTALDYWNTVCRFLKWLERTNIIERSPHRAVRLPKVKIEREIAPITREEYIKLREAAAGHWMDWIILLGWNTGMSISDCMLLKWGDVDLDNCCIRIKRLKSGTESLIPFDPSDELGRALAELREANPEADPDDYVSDDAGSKARIDSHEVGAAGTDAFREIANRAGIPKHKRFHGMRHTFVSMLANSGMSAILATKVTGHIDPRIFSRYVHADTTALRQGVAEARNRIGINQEIKVDPHGQRYKSINTRIWKPDTVYLVRRGKLKLPDGTPIQYVRSAPDATGRTAVVTPCDQEGNLTTEMRLIVDYRDVRSFS